MPSASDDFLDGLVDQAEHEILVRNSQCIVTPNGCVRKRSLGGAETRHNEEDKVAYRFYGPASSQPDDRVY